MLFSQKRRRDNPDTKYSSSILADLWKNASEEDKKVFNACASASNDTYKDAMVQYKRRKVQNPGDETLDSPEHIPLIPSPKQKLMDFLRRHLPAAIVNTLLGKRVILQKSQTASSLLEERARDRNLTLRDNSGCGDCGPEAILDAFKHSNLNQFTTLFPSNLTTRGKVNKLRKLMWDRLKLYPDRYIAWFCEGEFDEFVSQICRSADHDEGGYWFDQRALKVAADILRVHIEITEARLGDADPDPYLIRSELEASTTLHLGNMNNIHFVALIPELAHQCNNVKPCFRDNSPCAKPVTSSSISSSCPSPVAAHGPHSSKRSRDVMNDQSPPAKRSRSTPDVAVLPVFKAQADQNAAIVDRPLEVSEMKLLSAFCQCLIRSNQQMYWLKDLQGSSRRGAWTGKAHITLMKQYVPEVINLDATVDQLYDWLHRCNRANDEKSRDLQGQCRAFLDGVCFFEDAYQLTLDAYRTLPATDGVKAQYTTIRHSQWLAQKKILEERRSQLRAFSTWFTQLGSVSGTVRIINSSFHAVQVTHFQNVALSELENIIAQALAKEAKRLANHVHPTIQAWVDVFRQASFYKSYVKQYLQGTITVICGFLVEIGIMCNSTLSQGDVLFHDGPLVLTKTVPDNIPAKLYQPVTVRPGRMTVEFLQCFQNQLNVLEEKHEGLGLTHAQAINIVSEASDSFVSLLRDANSLNEALGVLKEDLSLSHHDALQLMSKCGGRFVSLLRDANSLKNALDKLKKDLSLSHHDALQLMSTCGDSFVSLLRDTNSLNEALGVLKEDLSLSDHDALQLMSTCGNSFVSILRDTNSLNEALGVLKEGLSLSHHDALQLMSKCGNSFVSMLRKPSRLETAMTVLSELKLSRTDALTVLSKSNSTYVSLLCTPDKLTRAVKILTEDLGIDRLNALRKLRDYPACLRSLLGRKDRTGIQHALDVVKTYIRVDSKDAKFILGECYDFLSKTRDTLISLLGDKDRWKETCNFFINRPEAPFYSSTESEFLRMLLHKKSRELVSVFANCEKRSMFLTILANEYPTKTVVQRLQVVMNLGRKAQGKIKAKMRSRRQNGKKKPPD
jgi:predicted nucleic acid-binding protein